MDNRDIASSIAKSVNMAVFDGGDPQEAVQLAVNEYVYHYASDAYRADVYARILTLWDGRILLLTRHVERALDQAHG